MKRIILSLMTLLLVGVAAPVQADEVAEAAPEGWTYWAGELCRLAHVHAGQPYMALNPILGIVEMNPDDCWVVVYEAPFYTSTTYYSGA